MVDAMGGPNSPHYNRFKSLCYTAFIGLRKNANLILNLIALMVDASIQDIRLEPDKAVLKVSEGLFHDCDGSLKLTDLFLTGTREIHAGYTGRGCDQASRGPPQRYVIPHPHVRQGSHARSISQGVAERPSGRQHRDKERDSHTSREQGTCTKIVVPLSRYTER